MHASGALLLDPMDLYRLDAKLNAARPSEREGAAPDCTAPPAEVISQMLSLPPETAKVLFCRHRLLPQAGQAQLDCSALHSAEHPLRALHCPDSKGLTETAPGAAGKR